MAIPSTASWRLSWASTSATDTLKAFRRRSLMLRTTCRLSLRLRLSRSKRRIRTEPTIMAFRVWCFVFGVSCLPKRRDTKHETRNTKQYLQGSLHLLDPVRLDDVIHLDVITAGHLH